MVGGVTWCWVVVVGGGFVGGGFVGGGGYGGEVAVYKDLHQTKAAR